MTAPIRVYVLDDHSYAVDSITRILATTPDLVCVGGYTRNSSDLPERVREARADVVIVDLVLGLGVGPEDARRHPEIWGIAAIEVLRRHFGQALKLVAWSNWPNLRQEVLDSGADFFLSKGASHEELVQVLRQVMGQARPRPVKDPGNIGQPIGLELFPPPLGHEDCAFLLQGSERNADPMSLEPTPFAFLYYLALERQQGKEGWVEKTGYKADTYTMKEPKWWQAVAERCEISWKTTVIETKYISAWARKINATTSRLYDATAGLKLIRVPGAGRGSTRSGNRHGYTLHYAIPSQGVMIHDTLLHPSVP